MEIGRGRDISYRRRLSTKTQASQEGLPPSGEREYLMLIPYVCCESFYFNNQQQSLETLQEMKGILTYNHSADQRQIEIHMFVILLRDTEKAIYCDGLQTSYNGPIVVLRALNILINP